MNKMVIDSAFGAGAKVIGEKALKSNPKNFNLDAKDLVKIISIFAKSLNH